MAMRFRKTIRLGRNTRVNLSKSGVSFSTGVKGLTVNTGPRGTYLTTTVPGTGVSSRTRIGGPPTKSKSKTAGSSQAGTVQAGTTAPDTTAAPGTPAPGTPAPGTPAQAGSAAQADSPLANAAPPTGDPVALDPPATDGLQTAEEPVDIVDIHTLAPEVFTFQDIANQLNALQPKLYVRQAYQRPEPTQQEIEAALWVQAEAKVDAVFSKQKKLQEYFTENYQSFWQYYMNQWQAEKAAFEQEQSVAEQQQNAVMQAEYDTHRVWLQQLLLNDEETIENAVEAWLADLELPIDIGAQIEYDCQSATLFIDLDLPEIEQIPTTVMKTLKSGQQSSSEKSQKQLRADYARLVFGLAVFIAACCFNLNANIAKTVISGYSQRRDKVGDQQDDYIYSVKIPRSLLEHRQVADPEEFFFTCENRVIMSPAYVFKTIIPYDSPTD